MISSNIVDRNPVKKTDSWDESQNTRPNCEGEDHRVDNAGERPRRRRMSEKEVGLVEVLVTQGVFAALAHIAQHGFDVSRLSGFSIISNIVAVLSDPREEGNGSRLGDTFALSLALPGFREASMLLKLKFLITKLIQIFGKQAALKIIRRVVNSRKLSERAKIQLKIGARHALGVAVDKAYDVSLGSNGEELETRFGVTRMYGYEGIPDGTSFDAHSQGVELTMPENDIEEGAYEQKRIRFGGEQVERESRYKIDRELRSRCLGIVPLVESGGLENPVGTMPVVDDSQREVMLRIATEEGASGLEAIEISGSDTSFSNRFGSRVLQAMQAGHSGDCQVIPRTDRPWRFFAAAESIGSSSSLPNAECSLEPALSSSIPALGENTPAELDRLECLLGSDIPRGTFHDVEEAVLEVELARRRPQFPKMIASIEKYLNDVRQFVKYIEYRRRYKFLISPDDARRYGTVKRYLAEIKDLTMEQICVKIFRDSMGWMCDLGSMRVQHVEAKLHNFVPELQALSEPIMFVAHTGEAAFHGYGDFVAPFNLGKEMARQNPNNDFELIFLSTPEREAEFQRKFYGNALEIERDSDKVIYQASSNLKMVFYFNSSNISTKIMVNRHLRNASITVMMPIMYDINFMPVSPRFHETEKGIEFIRPADQMRSMVWGNGPDFRIDPIGINQEQVPHLGRHILQGFNEGGVVTPETRTVTFGELPDSWYSETVQEVLGAIDNADSAKSYRHSYFHTSEANLRFLYVSAALDRDCADNTILSICSEAGIDFDDRDIQDNLRRLGVGSIEIFSETGNRTIDIGPGRTITIISYDHITGDEFLAAEQASKDLGGGTGLTSIVRTITNSKPVLPDFSQDIRTTAKTISSLILMAKNCGFSKVVEFYEMTCQDDTGIDMSLRIADMIRNPEFQAQHAELVQKILRRDYVKLFSKMVSLKVRKDSDPEFAQRWEGLVQRIMQEGYTPEIIQEIERLFQDDVDDNLDLQCEEGMRRRIVSEHEEVRD